MNALGTPPRSYRLLARWLASYLTITLRSDCVLHWWIMSDTCIFFINWYSVDWLGSLGAQGVPVDIHRHIPRSNNFLKKRKRNNREFTSCIAFHHLCCAKLWWLDCKLNMNKYYSISGLLACVFNILPKKHMNMPHKVFQPREKILYSLAKY